MQEQNEVRAAAINVLTSVARQLRKKANELQEIAHPEAVELSQHLADISVECFFLADLFAKNRAFQRMLVIEQPADKFEGGGDWTPKK